MERDKSSKRRVGPPAAGMTRVLALLLVVCLAECASEQRINSRGSKSSNLIEKINGWRSQRGGSCLSYGHSCWGAHGKRSGPAPAHTSDWFVKKLFGRFDANDELDPARNDDISDMYYENPELAEMRVEQIKNEEAANYVHPAPEPKYIGAKPMVDVRDPNKLTEIKLLQLLREASEELKH